MKRGVARVPRALSPEGRCVNGSEMAASPLCVRPRIRAYALTASPRTSQAIALARRPHVVVGTPGRVVDHLSNTKGFSMRGLKHLVLDEADKLLDMDFEQEIDQILKVGACMGLHIHVVGLYRPHATLGVQWRWLPQLMLKRAAAPLIVVGAG